MAGLDPAIHVDPRGDPRITSGDDVMEETAPYRSTVTAREKAMKSLILPAAGFGSG